MRNAREAVAAGLDFDQLLLIKTLVYATPDGWLLLAMRALDRIDYGALANAARVDRRKLRFAADADLEKTFGWQPGGAAPVAVVDGVKLVVDRAVLELPMIYFGGGRPDLTVEAEPAALFERVDYIPAVIAKLQRT